MVNIRQPELVCPVYDDCVGIGDIETRFDDRSADQHINFAINEFDHDLFKCPSRHLAMCHCYTSLWTEFLNPARHFLDRSYPVVYNKYLPASLEFSGDGFFDYQII